jgi:hypothetical protein
VLKDMKASLAYNPNVEKVAASELAAIALALLKLAASIASSGLNSTSFASLMEAAAMASATVDAGSAEAMMGRGLVVIVECAIWDRECSSEGRVPETTVPKTQAARPLRRGTARNANVQPRFALPLLVLRLSAQRNHCTTLST